MRVFKEKTAVACRNIVKEYSVGGEGVRVLDGISLKVCSGEFVSIMGESGSGKSTLLYILGGLDRPTEGDVCINGTDISGLSDENMSRMRRQKIGFVFQFYNLIPNLNAEENIMLPLLLDGKRAVDYSGRLAQMLELVGLTQRRKHTPRELSGGQQQRVAIARALMSRPEILFADEPTGNLDSRTGAEIMSLLEEINRERGQTIIMVTHSPEAAKSSSRIITVRDGKLKE
ncbi:ATP-binding cassette domain-containing protein [Lactonifactor sp. BIOML-A3]|uniref:ABC transporter ATP-binding protein n=1 Tax=Lactonifactor TaxID=420345 RepID=UPI0012AF172F|nr:MULTISPECIES: ABC transporter ATP-binding protein [Lactonifactor]MCB5714731.1 ABC transporter ATP-binding protein [Lactonifactor longoviformis]MCB5718685.1 ABC transporter ATP-binding protein [Lactonifactor longoviformis]MSA03892.1 ATP-binding cassette domain-containing protein [Lactonifactor sp. BIOML-A5]MSA10448.1 ATP-binding cassette domain-containing protein [Lactonifactor sp. BIOML-A4]MSA14951.1 ATP-binding cassette domain-containing protein [Lactonifactor sp. BIOML-A3]